MDEHPDPTCPLPDMVGDVPPEHDLRGRLMVLGIYACGAVLWAGIVFEAWEWGTRLALLIVAAPLFATAAFIARAVNRFECWSWFFVVGWFALFLSGIGTAFFLGDFTRSEMVSAAAMAMMLLGALHYLWLRRWDFWADARLERRRPPPRAVTPEWRAARLARMAPEAGRVHRTVSPRPGALWMRRTSPPDTFPCIRRTPSRPPEPLRRRSRRLRRSLHEELR